MSGIFRPEKLPSEGVGLMEPMSPPWEHPELSNLVLDLVAESSRLAGKLHPTARDSVAALVKRGLLVSDGPRTSVRLGFPVDVVGRWFPQLYPASAESK